MNAIKDFLDLPSTAMPRAVSDCPDDQCWTALRLIAQGKTAVGVCGAKTILLWADRDEWRDGIIVEVV